MTCGRGRYGWQAVIRVSFFGFAAVGCGFIPGPGGAGGVDHKTESASFHDDFDDPGSGWPVGNDGGTDTAYVDGAYEVAADGGKVAMAPAPAAHPPPGIALRVDTERVADSEGEFGGIWGVVCGADLAGSRFYEGVIQVSDGVGYPGLFGWHDGDIEVFRKADRPHEAVDPEGVNELQLECVDEGDSVTVVFSVNGDEVARAVDDREGAVDRWETGLIVDGSPMPSGSGTRMRFDNYAVEQSRS